jgi:hypothetical protein
MTTTTVAKLCVRCGREPRANEMFICRGCHANKTARFEIQTLLQSGESLELQRRRAIAEYHWAGGWGRV